MPLTGLRNYGNPINNNNNIPPINNNSNNTGLTVVTTKTTRLGAEPLRKIVSDIVEDKVGKRLERIFEMLVTLTNKINDMAARGYEQEGRANVQGVGMYRMGEMGRIIRMMMMIRRMCLLRRL